MNASDQPSPPGTGTARMQVRALWLAGKPGALVQSTGTLLAGYRERAPQDTSRPYAMSCGHYLYVRFGSRGTLHPCGAPEHAVGDPDGPVEPIPLPVGT